MLMITFLAHAGNSYEKLDTMSAIDHCMPILVGAGLIIAALLGIIFYMLRTWQPKVKSKAKTSRKAK